MTIKFACLNLWWGGNLMDGILDFLESTDADIIALQEVFENTEDPTLPGRYRSIQTIQDRLHYPHSDFAPAMLDVYPEAEVLNGNAVLSRFPVKDRKVTFFDTPFERRDGLDVSAFPTTPRNLQHLTLHTDSGDINLFNFQGVWDMDGDNFSEQRKKMSDTIIRETAGKQRVIVAGDTNARPTNLAMRALETEAHLTNIFGETLKTTFNMRRKDDLGYASSVVDLIYISHDVKPVAYACHDVDISDHLPLTATFEI